MNKSVKEIIDHNRILIEQIKEKNEVIFRYRDAINNINEKASLFGVNEQVNETIQEAIRVLEESE